MAYLIGTAGHVDHGKTTLIAALTGIDPDRLPEEKARGMTIDLGFAYVDVEGVGRVSIVDVPGHERFIKNMLAGASGVDVALLCVAADEGVMPQTREHFQILRLLEAKRMVVALTKCDLADREMIEYAKLDVAALLEGSPYEGCPNVEVAASRGVGVDELKNVLGEVIRALPPRDTTGKDWFLPIDRVFTIVGHGTVVTGTLARGAVHVGDEAELLPGGDRVRVRSIQTHGSASDHAEAGQRTALNIVGTKKELLHRGQALCAPGTLEETTCINIRLVEVAEIEHGERVRAHIGSGEFIGKVFLFDNAPGIAQLRLESPAACGKGQRLVLRRYSPPDLLAGGEVVTPSAKPRRKSDSKIAEIVQPTSDEPIAERILRVLSSKPSGTKTEEVCEALGMIANALGDAFEDLKKSERALGFAGVWLTPEQFDSLAERIRSALAKLHEANPRSSYHPKATVLQEAGVDWDPKPVDRLISRLAEERRVLVQGSGMRHPDFAIRLSDKQQELLSRVLEVMEKFGAVAPDAKELAGEAGAPPQAIEEIWRLGVETGQIVRVEEGMYYSRRTIEELETTVRQLGPRFTVAQFRDATGSSRKFALPLLQYFDEAKVTRRVGEERVVVEP